jgi:hypothetical protein
MRVTGCAVILAYMAGAILALIVIAPLASRHGIPY